MASILVGGAIHRRVGMSVLPSRNFPAATKWPKLVNQETIKNQIAERSEALDAFLETFDPNEIRDVQQELSSLMGVQVRLAAAEQRILRDDPMSRLISQS